MALNSGIQTNQILTNDDEVCIPHLSSILLAVCVHWKQKVIPHCNGLGLNLISRTKSKRSKIWRGNLGCSPISTKLVSVDFLHFADSSFLHFVNNFVSRFCHLLKIEREWCSIFQNVRKINNWSEKIYIFDFLLNFWTFIRNFLSISFPNHRNKITSIFTYSFFPNQRYAKSKKC